MGPQPGAKPLRHRVRLEVITPELNGDRGLNIHREMQKNDPYIQKHL